MHAVTFPAIKTQISEDWLGRKANAGGAGCEIAEHTSCCLPSTDDIRLVFVLGNQRALDRQTSEETSAGNQALWLKWGPSRAKPSSSNYAADVVRLRAL